MYSIVAMLKMAREMKQTLIAILCLQFTMRRKLNFKQIVPLVYFSIFMCKALFIVEKDSSSVHFWCKFKIVRVDCVLSKLRQKT